MKKFKVFLSDKKCIIYFVLMLFLMYFLFNSMDKANGGMCRKQKYALL